MLVAAGLLLAARVTPIPLAPVAAVFQSGLSAFLGGTVEVDGAELTWSEEQGRLVVRVNHIHIEDRDRAGQVARALEFGVDAYLSTPPDENRLFDTIFRQLNAVAMRKSQTVDEADLQGRLQHAHERIAQLEKANEELEARLARIEAALQSIE